jgi:hypothetical protein
MMISRSKLIEGIRNDLKQLNYKKYKGLVKIINLKLDAIDSLSIDRVITDLRNLSHK